MKSHVSDIVVWSNTTQVSLSSRYHEPKHVAACRYHSRVGGAVEAEGGKYREAGHLDIQIQMNIDKYTTSNMITAAHLNHWVSLLPGNSKAS